MNNRNYKDSVFVDLFAKDINAKENFVSLYNALHNTNLDYHTTEVEPVMIEQVLYKSFYNDIAMLIDNKIVILIEHQPRIFQPDILQILMRRDRQFTLKKPPQARTAQAKVLRDILKDMFLRECIFHKRKNLQQ